MLASRPAEGLAVEHHTAKPMPLREIRCARTLRGTHGLPASTDRRPTPQETYNPLGWPCQPAARPNGLYQQTHTAETPARPPHPALPTPAGRRPGSARGMGFRASCIETESEGATSNMRQACHHCDHSNEAAAGNPLAPKIDNGPGGKMPQWHRFQLSFHSSASRRKRTPLPTFRQ